VVVTEKVVGGDFCRFAASERERFADGHERRSCADVAARLVRRVAPVGATPPPTVVRSCEVRMLAPLAVVPPLLRLPAN